MQRSKKENGAKLSRSQELNAQARAQLTCEPKGSTQKKLHVTLILTEQGHHHPLVLARQWFSVSAPNFATGSKLL